MEFQNWILLAEFAEAIDKHSAQLLCSALQ